MSKSWPWLVIFVLFSTCKPDKGPDLPDDKPRIINMSLAGLPDENIRIDQQRNEITLQLPPDFAPPRAAEVMPTFQLTPDARVITNGGIYGFAEFRGINLCGCSPDALKIGVTERNPVPGQPVLATEYTIKLMPAGSMTVKPDNPAAFEYFLDDTKILDLAVSNYYDGSPVEVRLRSTDNPNESYPLRTGCGYQQLECPGRENLLRLWPDETSRLKPGTYQLEIRKDNGRTARAETPFVVKKGRTRLDYYTLVQRSMVAGEVRLTGNNLFADDNLEILLTETSGREHRLKSHEVSPFGREMKATLGSDVKPGYYALRLIKDGQVASDCYRFSVTRDEKQPYLLSVDQRVNPILANAAEFCPNATPVILQRGASTYPVVTLSTYPAYTGTLQLSGRLVSVENPQIGVDVLMVLTNSFAEPAAYLWVEATLRIPADLPLGRYHLLVRTSEKFTPKTYLSEPYERVIEVQ
ncbi:MAG: hypothetical protein LH606_08660 [Cytophagaceae bacterium]|nr:hypothetical protein [Cytophagaceae bacterium]